jgi:hypothetical protein
MPFQHCLVIWTSVCKSHYDRFRGNSSLRQQSQSRLLFTWLWLFHVLWGDHLCRRFLSPLHMEPLTPTVQRGSNFLEQRPDYCWAHLFSCSYPYYTTLLCTLVVIFGEIDVQLLAECGCRATGDVGVVNQAGTSAGRRN